MNIPQFALFLLVALFCFLFRSRRGTYMLVVSIFAVFWLQPALPVRNLDFWLPVGSLALVIAVWAVTAAGRFSRQDAITAAIASSLLLLLGLSRYFRDLFPVTASIPPDLLQIAAVALVIGGGIAALVLAIRRKALLTGVISAAAILVLLALFLVLKDEFLLLQSGILLRSLTGQSTALASIFDIRWLGFSYLAFRLIHTLRDRMTGRLPEVSLEEFLVYALFFPAYVSGPIDRLERFTADLRQPFTLTGRVFFDGGFRIVSGVFKKFVVADLLALVAINATVAREIPSMFGMWASLYAYSFRLYFDFSGYTDMAIGLGMWMGITLPENFDNPYSKSNLTTFWNSWHITLAQWFRAYFFNPVTRAMRSRWRNMPVGLIIFIGQMCTMILIGLWHGISWNFFLWGAWHGIGLIVHNRWSEFTRGLPNLAMEGTFVGRLRSWIGVFLTFHYVTIGWVWFALPSVRLSLDVIIKMFGLT